jgi:hypothetical protein
VEADSAMFPGDQSPSPTNEFLYMGGGIGVGDFNNNGFPDFIAGNLGLNQTFTTSPEEPFGVYAGDFNNNHQTDVFFTKRLGNSDYPFFGLAKYAMEHPHLMQRFRSFGAFSDVDMQELFGAGRLNNTLRYEADTFASVYVENNGDGTFRSVNLPPLAQISPIKSVLIHDVDGDGNLDLILAGNIYAMDPEITRADAGNGLWLRGDGTGKFEAISPFQSGLLVSKDVKSLALINTPNGYHVLGCNSNDSLQTFSIRP